MQGYDVLHYAYAPNSEIGFVFHTLAEVGEPWQKVAAKKVAALAKERKRVIQLVKLPRRPFIVEALVKNEPQT